jgi:PhnB protein
MKRAMPPAFQPHQEIDMAKKAAKPIPDGMHTVTPHLVCDGAAKAIEFYKKAFGAVEMMKLAGDDGKVMHACIQIGNSQVFLVDEMPNWGAFGPKALKGTPVTLHLSVADVDKDFQRAIDAGATVKMPLENAFWGDRYGIVEDPFGHNWSLATHIEDLTPEEIMKAGKEAMAAMGNC